MTALRVAVAGAGPVGRALASAWKRSDDTVTVAVRNPADARHDPYRADHDLVPLTELPAADAAITWQSTRPTSYSPSW